MGINSSADLGLKARGGCCKIASTFFFQNLAFSTMRVVVWYISLRVRMANGFVDIGNTIDERLDSLVHFVGSRVTACIGNVDCGCTSLDFCLNNSAEEIDFRPGCIFRGEFDVISVGYNASNPLKKFRRERLRLIIIVSAS